jgi:hypothetical protein
MSDFSITTKSARFSALACAIHTHTKGGGSGQCIVSFRQLRTSRRMGSGPLRAITGREQMQQTTRANERLLDHLVG